ncbi:hypothetical protein LEAN103870_01675 [Legionella anisa]|uniref:Fir n=1 Tax=Legionella anisa TaxID=28082 RepID=D6BJN4_9GAMM|nr:hypothetical protein [Legionella anisa]ACF77007.1 Fir [Legionella anisa]KTC72756.1 hypothetical protein Lani_0980 [Legionella anisa]PNL60705.1 hypothetical protein A6J39_005480 [Legionella anisa]UAK80544.1 hypothetical protein K8O89_05685 [Legionella anisa]
MAFFKNEHGGQDLKNKVTTEIKNPVEKMVSAMKQSGRDVSDLTEAEKFVDVVLKVHDQGPAALPQEALQTQEAKQQIPGVKEQLQEARQEQTTQEIEQVAEERTGFGLTSGS